MNLGKCAKKNWNWKPIQQSGLNFPEKSITGTIVAQIDVLDEIRDSTLQGLRELGFYGSLKIEHTEHSCCLMLKGSRDKKTDIENYNKLKENIELHFPSANKVVIAVKKSPSQINTIHCGQK